MDLGDYIIVYALTLLVFAIIDAIWIGVISKGFYKHFLKNRLAKEPRFEIATVFYLLFVAGLVYFAVVPGIIDNNAGLTSLNGALYGFFTFMTYQLTNASILKNWPLGVVGVDIAWGTVASLTASTLGYVLFIGLT